MNTAKTPLADIDAIRDQILEAAQNRFQTYGYGKTTMAEIAGDISMSAANLYRYFENKQDIAAACAARCLRERLDLFEEIVLSQVPSAEQKLRSYVLTSLRHTFQTTQDLPRVNELVDTILSSRQDIVHWKIEAECKQLSAILQQGIDSGEFEVDDIETTAEAIHSSLTKFAVPIFMSLYPLDVFEQKAVAVTELLLKGLKK